MSKILYVTPSLINSWEYSRKSEENYNEFIGYLGREPMPKTPAMLKGIEWENKIQQLCTCDESYLKKEIEQTENNEKSAQYRIALMCKHGAWQVPIFGTVKIPYGEIGIKGKIDILKMTKIIDLKRSARYAANKYSKSLQHTMYMYVTGIKKFEYVICDGNAYDIAVETYRLTDDSIDYMKKVIQEMLLDLETKKLINLYNDNWTMTDKDIENWIN